MYQILVDGYVLYDPRYDELIVNNPKCKLEVNTVGEASFSIYATHPYYGHMQKLKSVFEIRQDGISIFRGRMTDDTKDFDNIKMVDLEGVMAYFNDSIIRPFNYPDDFLNNSEYVASENKIEFFLKWLVDQHNSQVQPFQQLKLGVVTVSDPNNYIARSSEDYLRTWEVLKTKLFDSSLGGYLCIRYEEDGNYIDYLADFELTNSQKIKFGENLLDLSNESDASETYSALIPLGMRKNEINTSSSDDSRLTIESVSDGYLDEDIVKSGDMLYSESAVEKYGFICAPPSETVWEDVSDTKNLLSKGMEYLKNTAVKIMNTITIKAVDLHFSDEEIEAFRIYRYIQVESEEHNQNATYRLTQLDIDIHDPQNTVITLGDTTLTLTDINASNKKDSVESIETIKKNTSAFSEEIQKQMDASLQEVNEKVNNLDAELLELENTIDEVAQSVVKADEELQKQINAIVDGLENEWIYLTLNDDFAVCNEYEENKPMYKVTGNVIEVKGCVSPLEEFTSSDEKVVFATGIPSELCPSSIRSFICQGSGMNRWLLTIETDGSLALSRYGTTECASVPTTEELQFNSTYTI